MSCTQISVFDFMTPAQIADVQSNAATLDCANSFQAAVSAIQANPLGGALHVPSGTYLLKSGNINLNRSANQNLGRVSIHGEDMNSTKLLYAGTDPHCIYIENNQNPSLEQNASYQVVSDLCIVGATWRDGSIGLTVNLAAFFRCKNLYIYGFDYGLYCQDVDQAYFEKIICRWNNRGIVAQKNPIPGVCSTQPNNLVLNSCTISNNTQYGAYFSGGSAITFIGGDVEYNGAGVQGGFGLNFTDCGYEGGIGANIDGIYFEGNGNLADVIINSTSSTWGPLLGCVHNICATFNRNGHNSNKYNILVNFGDPAVVGEQKLVVNGSAFKSFSGYTPNTLTPNIGYVGVPANIKNFVDVGSFYSSPIEKPNFVQYLNKRDLVVAKSANQNFVSGAPATWGVDTILQPAPLWNPSLSGGIKIDMDGTYSISVFLALTTMLCGDKVVTILRNGNIIGSSCSNQQVSFITANIVSRFNAGDILTVNYQQNTGTSQGIAGMPTSRSNITIVQLYG